LTVLLSRYHEKQAETAPPPPADGAFPRCPSRSSWSPANLPKRGSLPAPPKTTTTKAKGAAAAEKEEEPEPVYSKDHLERAADLLSDLQVETFSSMDKREKTELCVAFRAARLGMPAVLTEAGRLRDSFYSILDQMRLESGRDNWTRVRVGSRKINRAYLKEEGNAVRAPPVSTSARTLD
jgi:hypothetical protein